MTENRIPVRIFDTTLRDGEQSPGASLNHQEKMEIARTLDAMGVDVIEAGFPITSQDDFDAVRAIGEQMEHAVVAGLARCTPRDIDRAGEALERAHKPRLHVLGAGSRIHLEHKLRKTPEQMTELTARSIEQARSYTDDVEFSPEDGSRTDPAYLVEITRTAIEAGATTINIPDTVGYAVPAEYGRIFSLLREELPLIDQRDIVLSAHCHNDLGLAAANSLAAVRNGARQVECTVNGIGERAGNAALEEIVMAMRTRRDYYDRWDTGVDTRRIYPVSRMVAHLTGLDVQRNKAVIGENAFAHEAGIHQDGMLKNRSTYEIMDPADIGVPESKLVLGKHSGRHAFADRVSQLGYALDAETITRAFEAFKTLADKKKEVYDEDIEAILDQELETDRQLWTLGYIQTTSGTGVVATATVSLVDSAGTQRMDAATGDGPIDAVYSAIQRITGVPLNLEEYRTRAVTGGQEAQGEATVRVSHHGRQVRGRGLSTDVIEAAARAYLSAINRIKTTEARAVAATAMEAGEVAEQP